MANLTVEDTAAPSRSSMGRRRLLVAVLVLLLLGVLLVLAARNSVPGKISVRFVDLVERPEGVFLRVAITNTGTSSVFKALTAIETGGGHKMFSLTGQPSLVRLRAGEGSVTEYRLPDRARGVLSGQWRITCNCGDGGIRSWIWRRRSDPAGLVARFYQFVPRSLRGMPLNVIGKSDLNEPVLLHSTAAPPKSH